MISFPCQNAKSWHPSHCSTSAPGFSRQCFVLTLLRLFGWKFPLAQPPLRIRGRFYIHWIEAFQRWNMLCSCLKSSLHQGILHLGLVQRNMYLLQGFLCARLWSLPTVFL